MISSLISQLKSISTKHYLIYVAIYFIWGLAMNWFGQEAEIARFTYWWQVITVYVLYMIPISIILRPYNFITQYAYGLIAMGILEFGGYALGTSYIYPNNILDLWFGPHVFALSMTLFFGLYFPLGNLLVNWIYKKMSRS